MSMSYCRFHNTTIDLEDCLNALENGDLENINDNEKRAINKLLTTQLERLNEIKEFINDVYDGDINKWIEVNN